MTRDPLTDPQPGDVVRGWYGDVSDDYRVTARVLDAVWWDSRVAPHHLAIRTPLATWCSWPMYERWEVVCLGDPLDSARLASEAAEAEVRALTEALEAARRRSLEAYAAYASAVQRGVGEALRALRS